MHVLLQKGDFCQRREPAPAVASVEGLPSARLFPRASGMRLIGAAARLRAGLRSLEARRVLVTSCLSQPRPAAVACLLTRLWLQNRAGRKSSVPPLRKQTVSSWRAASCFRDLPLMCFVLAPKEIQLRGVSPQAADVRQQPEEDKCPQRWEPHI